MKLISLLITALVAITPVALDVDEARACGGGYGFSDPDAPVRSAASTFIQSSKLPDGSVTDVPAVDHAHGTATVAIRWTRRDRGRTRTYERTLRLVRVDQRHGSFWTVRDLGEIRAVTPTRTAA